MKIATFSLLALLALQQPEKIGTWEIRENPCSVRMMLRPEAAGVGLVANESSGEVSGTIAVYGPIDRAANNLTIVRLRFGIDAVGEFEPWEVADDLKVALSQDPYGFMRKLRDARRLRVTVSIDGGRDFEVEFRPSKTAEAFAAFDACRGKS